MNQQETKTDIVIKAEEPMGHCVIDAGTLHWYCFWQLTKEVQVGSKVYFVDEVGRVVLMANVCGRMSSRKFIDLFQKETSLRYIHRGRTAPARLSGTVLLFVGLRRPDTIMFIELPEEWNSWTRFHGFIDEGLNRDGE